MEKIVDATYDGEVVRFDEPVQLVSNSKVKVIIADKPRTLNLVEAPKKGISKPYAAFDFAIAAKLDGPSDFSNNLDDYLNGVKSLGDDE